MRPDLLQYLDENEKALYDAAKKATPGPWRTWKWESKYGARYRILYKARGLNRGAEFTITDLDGTEGHDENNAAHIAAANPSAIISLLTALATEREERVTLEEALQDIEKTIHIGVDEGPVYCDKPECVIADIKGIVDAIRSRRKASEATTKGEKFAAFAEKVGAPGVSVLAVPPPVPARCNVNTQEWCSDHQHPYGTREATEQVRSMCAKKKENE